jgi:hypothetical protein
MKAALIVALMAMSCAAQSVPSEHPTYTNALPDETAWQWLVRNNLGAIPISESIEIEPSKPLMTSLPWIMPNTNDPLYNAQAEHDIMFPPADGKTIKRIYRRGVFCGYSVIRSRPMPGSDCEIASAPVINFDKREQPCMFSPVL